jgi:polyhydroxyalkanoate synthesis regulator phasin
MNANYKPIQKQADKLRYRMQDMIDDASSTEGKQLISLSRDVMECIESDKPPRTVESRILQLMRLLEGLGEEANKVISAHDAHSMADEYEELRREVRKLPNY